MTVLLTTDLPGLSFKGKVRDTYAMGDRLLMIATDRLSAFDVVLPDGIPDKGRVLTLLSEFWFGRTRHLVSNHLLGIVGVGNKEIDAAVAAHFGPSLAKISADLSGRSMLVRKAERIDIECVVRGYLAGSAWSEYAERGTVCGEAMPTGLQESEKLPEPIFTPAAKADTGHDENISIARMKELVGGPLTDKLMEITLSVYSFADNYARQKGIIIADTKMEFGLIDGEVILIDELLTPDSSRFWDAEGYQVGRSQPSFDKQFVRDWLSASGWDKEPPGPRLPDDVVEKTTEKYREAYQRITSQSLG
ncbi:MAG: phosphoribosylaminoimidazolesuccinocarboxamide synthase [Dehalococcoidia bacterium]|nr:phosphoribosylaminoimidazolesuccinocarboxamide synthase [Dehalococcoidia bacterium]